MKIHSRRAALGGAVLALLVGCPEADDGVGEVQPRAVEVTTARTGDAVSEVRVVGTLEGENEVQIFAQITERIVSLRVKEGQRVRRGKVLAVLSSQMQSEAVKQADASLGAAEAGRDALADEVERMRKLVGAGGASGAAQMQQRREHRCAVALGRAPPRRGAGRRDLLYGGGRHRGGGRRYCRCHGRRFQ